LIVGSQEASGKSKSCEPRIETLIIGPFKAGVIAIGVFLIFWGVTFAWMRYYHNVLTIFLLLAVILDIIGIAYVVRYRNLRWVNFSENCTDPYRAIYSTKS